MGVVDYEFYSTVYMGTDADSASFPALCARASDVIGAMTRWAVDDLTEYPAKIQELYKKAVCAQIDFFAVNGLDSVSESGTGFTVGKVHVDGVSRDRSSGGAMANSVASLAYMYLEQTGLLNPQVPTVDNPGFYGWW